MGRFALSSSRPARAVAAVAALLGLLSAAPAAACDLTVGWDPFAPYQKEGRGSDPEGIDIDLVTAFAEEAGCTLTFIRTPWARQLMEIEAGALDMALAATPTEERAAYAHFTRPYRDEEFRLYIRREDAEAGRYPQATLADVVAAMDKVGIMRGFYAGPEVEALQADPATAGRFDEGTNEGLSLKKLAAGRIEGVIAERAVAADALRAHDLDGVIRLHPVAVHATGVTLMLSRASVPESVRERLDAAIGTIRASDRYGAILAGYL